MSLIVIFVVDPVFAMMPLNAEQFHRNISVISDIENLTKNTILDFLQFHAE